MKYFLAIKTAHQNFNDGDNSTDVLLALFETLDFDNTIPAVPVCGNCKHAQSRPERSWYCALGHAPSALPNQDPPKDWGCSSYATKP